MKKVASGKTTLYHYAGGNLISETDENGVPLRDYVYLNGEPVALRIYGAQFGTMYYFINDHLGTPQKILDSSAQVVWAAAYLPFGKAQIKPEIITNNLRFPGQYFDAESGLHYNWNRYYDPETGRYITADPIGLAGGVNLYVYTENNPINKIDPSGQSTVLGGAALGGAFGGPAGAALGAAGGFILGVGIYAIWDTATKSKCKDQRRCRCTIRLAPPHIMAQCQPSGFLEREIICMTVRMMRSSQLLSNVGNIMGIVAG